MPVLNKQKSLSWIHSSSKKLIRQIEKFKIYYNGGYKKIQPRILAKGVLSMVPPLIVESEEDNCKEHFIPCLGTLKKHQVNNCKLHTFTFYLKILLKSFL